jgi:hypothetical protein
MIICKCGLTFKSKTQLRKHVSQMSEEAERNIKNLLSFQDCCRAQLEASRHGFMTSLGEA